MSIPREGSRDTDKGILVSCAPDWCWVQVGSSRVLVPFNIYAKQADDANTAPTVRQQGKRSHTSGSLILECHGDEAGNGLGVKSGTKESVCQPKTWSKTVRIEGKHAVRHNDEWWMNNRNTIGKLAYMEDVNTYEKPKGGDGPNYASLLNDNNDIFKSQNAFGDSVQVAQAMTGTMTDAGGGATTGSSGSATTSQPRSMSPTTSTGLKAVSGGLGAVAAANWITRGRVYQQQIGTEIAHLDALQLSSPEAIAIRNDGMADINDLLGAQDKSDLTAEDVDAARAIRVQTQNQAIAQESADAKSKADAQASDKVRVSRDRPPKCDDLEKEINRRMYNNKRAPGSKDGIHGLNYRRAEQICGQYGPGMERMGFKIVDGVRRWANNIPWDEHRDIIAKQQKKLKELKEQYDDMGCAQTGQKFNENDYKRMTDENFNPSPEQWLGPDHPSCQGLNDLIRNNRTPELPKL